MSSTMSFERVSEWAAAVSDVTNGFARCVLVANKSDKVVVTSHFAIELTNVQLQPHVVTEEEGRGLARHLHMCYVETSAVTGEGIADLFHKLAELV